MRHLRIMLYYYLNTKPRKIQCKVTHNLCITVLFSIHKTAIMMHQIKPFILCTIIIFFILERDNPGKSAYILRQYLPPAGALVVLRLDKDALLPKIRMSERSELRIFESALSRLVKP